MRVANGFVSKPVGKVFETQYGEKQMMIVTMDNGTEEKIYCKAGQEPHVKLQRNDQVSIIYENKNGRDIRRLVVPESNVQNSTPSFNSSVSPTPNRTANDNFPRRESKPVVEETPRDFANREIETILELFRITEEKFKNAGYDLGLEDTRAIAISVAINAQRNFRGDFTLTERGEEPEEEERGEDTELPEDDSTAIPF